VRSQNKIKKNTLDIPSDVKYIRKVSSDVLKSLSSYAPDGSLSFDIKLCVEEAVLNAIAHGNRRDKDKRVRIAYWVEDGRLIVEVEDEGRGFDYRNISNPTEEGNILKASGRGVFLIRHLMDEVEYNDSGNRIRMVKKLTKDGL